MKTNYKVGDHVCVVRYNDDDNAFMDPCIILMISGDYALLYKTYVNDKTAEEILHDFFCKCSEFYAYDFDNEKWKSDMQKCIIAPLEFIRSKEEAQKIIKESNV